MMANTLRLRGVHFAFLFGPPKFIGRVEASEVHGKLCEELGHDDFAFRYSTPSVMDKPESKGFLIAFERKEGRGAFTATIGMKSVNEPIRLLLSYAWPPSRQDAEETFDMTSKVVFESLEGNWHRILAEARLQAQCDTRKKSGLAFITKELLRLDEPSLAKLGTPLSLCSVKFEVAATSPSPTENSLDGPKREVQIEVLREDPRGLYLEIMCQWPQIAAIPVGTTLKLDPSNVREIVQTPSEYLRYAYDYLENDVTSLPGNEGEQ